MRPKIKGPLFIHLSHRGVHRFQLCSILKSAICFAGYNPVQYNTHSFIIGTTVVMLGNTHDQIKLKGRWKYNTFQKYITLGF
jgi:uncharacterized protein (DUF779 family)